MSYPRLAHYTMNRGHGAPLLKPDGTMDVTLIHKLARHHVIAPDITPWYSPQTLGRVDVLQAMRRLNPNLKILAYQLFAWWYLPITVVRTSNSWADNWHRALVETDGLLDGQWVKWDNPATEARLTKLLCDLAASRLFDGVFFDYFDAFKSVSAGGWNQAVDRAVHAIQKAGGPGFLVLGNGGDLRNGNGNMREGFPSNLLISNELNVRLWRSGRPHKTHDWLQAGTGHTDPTNPNTQRAARYAHGYACLFDMMCSFGPDRDQTIPYHGWWFDFYEHDGKTGWLGEPLGPATNTGGLWHRRFALGDVYVNPTDIPRPRPDFISVPAKDAMFVRAR